MQIIKLLIVSLALSVAGPALAQRLGPAPGLHFDMDGLAVLLDLDEYQKQEVARVIEEQREKTRAMRFELRSSEEDAAREEIRAHREQLAQELQTELGTVLSELQMTKFQLLMEWPGRPGRMLHRGR